MPGLYDAYQLANSREIPRYQGSAIPELTKVASTLESRYDEGLSSADLLDQSLKTSSAAPVDQPLLNTLKNQYRDKLKAYADKGDYENMWRDVAMDARDFTNQYKGIAANQQAMASWKADLDKRVGEGKLDPAVAKARTAQMMDTYTGLKADPGTGQYTNLFTGASTVPSIDIPKKINEWLSESHAIERGWKAEKDVNGWYVTNGSERKSLPWSMIKPIIDAGVQLDPEVKGWLSQEHELAPYYQGLSRKIDPAQIDAVMKASPAIGNLIQAKVNAGMSKVDALHAVLGDAHVTDRINEIYGYAHKGVQDVQKGEYAEKMDPITEELAKKKIKEQEKMLFSAPFSDVGPGTKISSVKDFDAERGKAQQEKNELVNQLGAMKNGPGKVSYESGIDAGKVFRREADGSLTDITEDANNLRKQIQAADDRIRQYDNIKQSAADATNYHPTTQSSPAARTEANRQADEYKKAAIDRASHTYANSRGGETVTGYRTPTKQEIDEINQKAEQIRSTSLQENHPAYKDYEQELIKRLQPQGTGNMIWAFNDDEMKRSLADFTTSALSNLGTDKGLLSLQIGSGKHAGENFSASDYDDIKGKVTPVGIYNDARSGDTKIMLRANQDIRGKKVKGENIVMSMKDVGGLDNYVKSHISPEDYHKFAVDRALKAGLNNVAGQMNYPIQHADGTTSQVQVTRRQSTSQGAGAFEVRVQTPSGWKAIPADSYDGVIDILNRIQAQHK